MTNVAVWRATAGVVAGLALATASGCRDKAPATGPAASAPQPVAAATQPRRPFRLDMSLPIDLARIGGIAVDTAARLYVVGEGGVRVYDVEGREVRRWATSGSATCVAVDADGFVYVGQRTRVERFDPTGRRVAQWGVEGSGVGQLRHVTSIAVVGANVLVADAGNRCVHRFDVTGDFIGDIGRRDPADNVPGLIVPSPHLDVAIGPGGVVYVTNPGRRRVERYDLTGRLTGAWGRASLQPDGFCGCCNPTDIAVDAQGHVFTAEKGLVRVKQYDAAGALLAIVADMRLPQASTGLDLAVGPRARVYVADAIQGRVHVFSEPRTETP